MTKQEPANRSEAAMHKAADAKEEPGREGRRQAGFWKWRQGEPAASYWLARFLILRLLGLVYCVAFLVAAQQIIPLIGQNGLLPAETFLRRVEASSGSRFNAFLQLPTLFWFNVSDGFIVSVAWLGVGLSLVVLLGYDRN